MSALPGSDAGSVLSDEHTVVISEELPMIESKKDSSLSHRAGKLMQRIKQTEWISELDLFSIPLKLNFKGEDTHKTEFGGFLYLMVVVTCVILTILFQFPDGLTLESPITFYNVV